MVVSKRMPIHSFPQVLLRIFNSDLLAYSPLAVLSSVFDSLQGMGRNSPFVSSKIFFLKNILEAMRDILEALVPTFSLNYEHWIFSV